jgi:hypothetical protein
MDEWPAVPPAAAGIDERIVAVSRRVIAALAVTLVVRGLVWPFSLFFVGPVFGAVSFAALAEPFGPALPVMVEGVLTAAATVFAIAVSAGVRRDPEQWLPRARAVGRALAVQTIFYVTSLVVVALIWGGWSNLAELAGPIAVVAVLDIPVLLLALSINRGAGTCLRRAPQPLS